MHHRGPESQVVDEFVLRRTRPKGAQVWLLPLASGFIAGEALVAILLPILIALGFLAVV